MLTDDLIFELGCEELPTLAVRALSDALQSKVTQLLAEASLKHGRVQAFATPRRLALIVNDLQLTQDEKTVVRRGPAVAQPGDNPSPAVQGFAKSCGVSLDQLTVQTNDKGSWWIYESVVPGGRAYDLIPPILSQAIEALPISKAMRWGNGDYEFARPVHWALLLLGQTVLPLSILGVHADNKTFGHRFHHNASLEISNPIQYEAQLMKAYVVADFATRRLMIREQVSKIAASVACTAVMPDELLDEVTSIVEWPRAILAHFDEAFLEVPPEALIAAMQSHQKSFALLDAQGKLTAHFIAVANIESRDPKQVALGNERVMRARLSDAAFFFQQDKRTPLIAHQAKTQTVVYQAKLGSLADKTKRLRDLMMNLQTELSLTTAQIERATALSKCDLMTGMVGEFPELQGLMGYYYARHDGEPQEIALALKEQYMPRFAGDDLPSSQLGFALSLVDRLDALVGGFAVGLKPTATKDPFKLRRHALALVRMLIGNTSSITVSNLLEQTRVAYTGQLTINTECLHELRLFILERLHSFYQNQGIKADLVTAVRARQEECLYDLNARIQSLAHFMELPEFQALTAACKRVNKILASGQDTSKQVSINEQLLTEPAEQNLYQFINSTEQTVSALYAKNEYSKILLELTRMSESIDQFFESVLVMSDATEVKNNRLNLLTRLQTLLQGVADISLISH